DCDAAVTLQRHASTLNPQYAKGKAVLAWLSVDGTVPQAHPEPRVAHECDRLIARKSAMLLRDVGVSAVRQSDGLTIVCDACTHISSNSVPVFLFDAYRGSSLARGIRSSTSTGSGPASSSEDHGLKPVVIRTPVDSSGSLPSPKQAPSALMSR